MNHFPMLARYNRWANIRLYDAAAKLAETDYFANKGAFFGSMHGTLNHLLVGDRVWMHRFTGEGPKPTKLDAIDYEDLPSLRVAREDEDERIVTWTESLSKSDLDASISYRAITAPEPFTQPLRTALPHFFNHQTHHRGQAHMILTVIGGRDAAPPLDILYYQRETNDGLAPV